MSLHVAIDVKNLALYAGGIAGFMRPLVAAWMAHRPDFRFSLVAPPFDSSAFAASRNWTAIEIRFPVRLPRSLRHPIYDMVLFPRMIARLNPQFVLSLYHDVLLPGPSTGIANAMMVYDTCLGDLPEVYPRRIRLYYLALLRANLKRAGHILTISQASRARIADRYQIRPDRLSVIYNSVDPSFAAQNDADSRTGAIRARYAPSKILFYAGGSEYRKNLSRLLDALEHLARESLEVRLLTTGTRDDGWDRVLAGRGAAANKFVTFLGRLNASDVEFYYAAADAVVYPTLCEGFGRVCLEAMAAGAPLACSDLPVLREVAGDYACYFNPRDPGSIASGIKQALAAGHRLPQHDPRFASAAVERSFLEVMDRLTDGIAARS
jgi:glycosyltransferase involved in cell wall biosynthesis